MRLDGKVALITDGGNDIGAAGERCLAVAAGVRAESDRETAIQ